MDKNKLPLIFHKIPRVIAFDETVLESWYGIFESVLSYGIIFRGFARNGKKLGMVFVPQNTALGMSRNSRVFIAVEVTSGNRKSSPYRH